MEPDRGPPLATTTSNAMGFTREQARRALERWVRATWLRRRGLSERLELVAFETPGTHRVTFQSSTEQRTVSRASVPYRGGPVDGPERGPAPEPWSIPVQQAALFTDAQACLEVPHTSQLGTCHGCAGSGEVTCGGCGGDGRCACSWCGGSGTRLGSETRTSTDANGNSTTETVSVSERCSTCGGSGRVTCSQCSGSGRVTCGVCQGARTLRYYQRMVVTWTNAVTVEVSQGAGLPEALLKLAEGRVVLLEEEPSLAPALGGSGAGAFRGGRVRLDETVNGVINGLIERHRFAAGTKIHRQRLTVHAVPVVCAVYRWGKSTRWFFVYGAERVYAPGFPLSVPRVLALVASLAAVVSAVVALVIAGL